MRDEGGGRVCSKQNEPTRVRRQCAVLLLHGMREVMMLLGQGRRIGNLLGGQRAAWVAMSSSNNQRRRGKAGCFSDVFPESRSEEGKRRI